MCRRVEGVCNGSRGRGGSGGSGSSGGSRGSRDSKVRETMMSRKNARNQDY